MIPVPHGFMSGTDTPLPPLPVNIRRPSIYGVTASLVRREGTWLYADTVTGEWYVNGTGTGITSVGVNANGVTVGNRIEYVETATNAAGSVQINSNAFGPGGWAAGNAFYRPVQASRGISLPEQNRYALRLTSSVSPFGSNLLLTRHPTIPDGIYPIVQTIASGGGGDAVIIIALPSQDVPLFETETGPLVASSSASNARLTKTFPAKVIATGLVTGLDYKLTSECQGVTRVDEFTAAGGEMEREIDLEDWRGRAFAEINYTDPAPTGNLTGYEFIVSHPSEETNVATDSLPGSGPNGFVSRTPSNIGPSSDNIRAAIFTLEEDGIVVSKFELLPVFDWETSYLLGEPRLLTEEWDEIEPEIVLAGTGHSLSKRGVSGIPHAPTWIKTPQGYYPVAPVNTSTWQSITVDIAPI